MAKRKTKKKGKKTLFDEFCEYHAEFVHEASHVRQLEKALKKAGVDVKKWKDCSTWTVICPTPSKRF